MIQISKNQWVNPFHILSVNRNTDGEGVEKYYINMRDSEYPYKVIGSEYIDNLKTIL